MKISERINLARVRRGIEPLELHAEDCKPEIDAWLENHMIQGATLDVRASIGQTVDKLTTSELYFRNMCKKSKSWLIREHDLRVQGAQIAERDSVFEIFWKDLYKKSQKTQIY